MSAINSLPAHHRASAPLQDASQLRSGHLPSSASIFSHLQRYNRQHVANSPSPQLLLPLSVFFFASLFAGCFIDVGPQNNSDADSQTDTVSGESTTTGGQLTGTQGTQSTSQSTSQGTSQGTTQGTQSTGDTTEPPGCGDGIIDPPEECDQGSNNSNASFCTEDCNLAKCGDGFVQVGVEACDDGNRIDNDSCTNNCSLATCGDGVQDEGEDCDDGNASNTDKCLNTCIVASCGDGFVNDETEDCDDQNTIDTDACLNNCQEASCGDGVVHEGVEACDDGNQANDDACPNTCASISCGDGIVQVGEACDDGNLSDTDACLSTCFNASCGDGFVQAGVEDCDDSNSLNTDSCTNTCNDAVCGDGFVQEGIEECDDGNSNNDDDCSNLCKAADSLCGDGDVGRGEECDDGNQLNTDACTNICKNAFCGDGFVYKDTEICDGLGPVPHTTCAQNCMSASCTNTNGDAWGDCNNDALDGCEVSFASPLSCGGCGVKCKDSQVCKWFEIGNKYFCNLK